MPSFFLDTCRLREAKLKRSLLQPARSGKTMCAIRAERFLKRLKLVVCTMALRLSDSASAGVDQFFLPAWSDLSTAANARGFPVAVRLWATNREAALRYAGRDDGEDSLMYDCHRNVPGDDGGNNDPKLMPEDSIRCASVAVALFDSGAIALIGLNEAVVSPLGVGSTRWQGISDAIRQRVGDELALALVAAHEMGHVAWRQGVLKAAHAQGCGSDCDPALFYESDLEEAYCDFLAAWIVSVRHGNTPEELMAALAAGRATLKDHYINEWSALAELLMQARIPGYAQMDFDRASHTALEWAMRIPGLRERWTISASQEPPRFE